MNVNENMGTEEERLYILINILEPVHCKQGWIKFLLFLFSVIHKYFYYIFYWKENVPDSETNFKRKIIFITPLYIDAKCFKFNACGLSVASHLS
jgi:hypothetical protein